VYVTHIGLHYFAFGPAASISIVSRRRRPLIPRPVHLNQPPPHPVPHRRLPRRRLPLPPRRRGAGAPRRQRVGEQQAGAAAGGQLAVLQLEQEARVGLVVGVWWFAVNPN
jgi:hypothetical protein